MEFSHSFPSVTLTFAVLTADYSVERVLSRVDNRVGIAKLL